MLIGDEPISSFTDEGAGATVAANLYPETYRDILASHPWTFALKEQWLSRLSQQPAEETGFKYAFQLPADFIRAWAIFPYQNYTIVGLLLYSNEPEVLLRFVYQVDETKLPPHVTKAIEYRLASEFAMSVTESSTKAEYYEVKAANQLSKAKSIDSQGKPPVPIIDSPFTDVRLNGEGNSQRGFF